MRERERGSDFFLYSLVYFLLLIWVLMYLFANGFRSFFAGKTNRIGTDNQSEW